MGLDAFGVAVEHKHVREEGGLHAFSKAEDVLGWLDEFLEQAVESQTTGVLVAAGPPCQPWSGLGNQRGTSDPRSESIKIKANIKDTLAKACKSRGLRFGVVAENVASMAKEEKANQSQCCRLWLGKLF